MAQPQPTAIEIITALPTFITPEEHKNQTSQTPTSFADIPPVIRHLQSDVTVKFEPPLQDLSEDDLKHGSLYVIESVLAYMNASGSKGFAVPYPNVTLHAVSRSDNGPSIYCQIDSNPDADLAAGGEDDGDIADLIELTIIPTDPNSVEAIFEALSICASLHPDPSQPEDDEDDEAFIDANGNGEFEVFDGSEEQELSEVGRAALAHLESIIDYPPGHPNYQANGAEHDDEETEDNSGR